MASKFILDGITIADDPIGWNTATITATRSAIARGLFTSFILDLQFIGDGFLIIYNKVRDGFCNEVTIEIQSDDCIAGTFITEFSGVIPLTKLKELRVSDNSQSCSVKAKLVDNGFEARILNNRDLTAVASSTVSKNGTTITAAPVQLIDLFDPTDGVYKYTDVRCFKAFDVGTFIIAYITDGSVSFESSLLDTGGEYENVMLTTGAAIRAQNNFVGAVVTSEQDVDTSFLLFVSDINKARNISWAIEVDVNGDPVFRLELVDFFFQDEAAFALENVANVFTDFNISELYSSIDVGSEDFLLKQDGALTYPDSLLKGFKKENYTLEGLCNENLVLDLISNYIIDSNQIENILRFNDDDVDERTVLINTNGTQAVQTQPFVIGDFAYNEIFTNFNKINNWSTNLHNNVRKDIGIQLNNFSADININIDKTIPVKGGIDLIDPIIYNNEITDPGGNYDPVTGRYVIPVLADGLYALETNNDFFIDGLFGDENISNGDFISSTDWIFGLFWSFIPGSAELNASFQEKQGFLSQSFLPALDVGPNYKLQFDLNDPLAGSFTGTCQVFINNVLVQEFTSTGTKVLQINSNNFGDITNIKFGGIKRKGLFGLVRFAIDNVSLIAAPAVRVVSRIQRMNSIATIVLEEFSRTDIIRQTSVPLVTNTNTITHNSGTFTAFAGQVIRASVTYELIDGNDTLIRVVQDSTYETTLTNDAGGKLFTIDNADFRPYIHIGDADISLTQWRNMIDNPERAIVFNNGTQQIIGHRERLDYNRETGTLKFKLKSKTLIDI